MGKAVQWTDIATVSVDDENKVTTNYYDVLEIDERKLEVLQNNRKELIEYVNVGAGIGGGFTNTLELKVMKYHESINRPDGKAWKEKVGKKHQRVINNGVFKPVKISELPKGIKLIDVTWAMKKKSLGTLRGRVNVRGFCQIEGGHYDGTSISAPVANVMTIKMSLALMLMQGWIAHVVDMKGAFLYGKFEDGEKVHIKVPLGFEEFYDMDTALLLKKTLYGVKQAAIVFYRKSLKAMANIALKRSSANPCLYYKWVDGRLVIMISWINDNMILGPSDLVMQLKNDLMQRFDCDDCGHLEEYVGNKIEYVGNDAIRFVQTILMQSYSDEFLLEKRCYNTPAQPGTVLMKPPKDSNQLLDSKDQSKLRSGIGKLLWHMQYSRPDIPQAVRDLARHMTHGDKSLMDAILQCMQYLNCTKDAGLILKPERKWDGSDSFQFKIKGRSDSDYAKDTLVLCQRCSSDASKCNT